MFIILKKNMQKWQNIIQIYYNNNIKENLKHSINIDLKPDGRIYKPKKHHHVFKQFTSCPKRYLSLVILFDSTIIVGIFHINICKYPIIPCAVKYIISKMKKISIFHHHGIERTLIDKQLSSTIKLRSKQNRCSDQRFQKSNKSLSKLFINVFTENLKLVLKKIVR